MEDRAALARIVGRGIDEMDSGEKCRLVYRILQDLDTYDRLRIASWIAQQEADRTLT